MPKLSRFKTYVDFSNVTAKNDREKIVSTMHAVEVFSFLSCIAMGMLTIISLQYPNLIWGRFAGWLRTRSSETPSIEQSTQYCSRSCGGIFTKSVVMRLYQIFSSIKTAKNLSVTDPLHRGIQGIVSWVLMVYYGINF